MIDTNSSELGNATIEQLTNINTKILLGTITFECALNGIVVVKVSEEDGRVTISSDARLTKSALMPKGDGVQMESSVVFSLFNTMMEAQREKGQS